MPDQLTGLGSITDILRIEPNWINEIGGDLQLSKEILEFPGTVQEQQLHTTDRPVRYTMRFSFLSRSELRAFEVFFHSMKGRHGCFWMPSPSQQFDLFSDHTLGEGALRYKENGFEDVFKGYERVFVQKVDGSLLTYEISSISDGVEEGQKNLNLGENLDQNITIDECDNFSLLHLMRFDIDEPPFDFLNDGTAELNITVTELVKEYP